MKTGGHYGKSAIKENFPLGKIVFFLGLRVLYGKCMLDRDGK